MFYIAAMFVKYCYINGRWLFWFMSLYTLFRLLTTRGKINVKQDYCYMTSMVGSQHGSVPAIRSRYVNLEQTLEDVRFHNKYPIGCFEWHHAVSNGLLEIIIAREYGRNHVFVAVMWLLMAWWCCTVRMNLVSPGKYWISLINRPLSFIRSDFN